MNPYNLQQNFYPVGDTIALAIYLFINNMRNINAKSEKAFRKYMLYNFWFDGPPRKLDHSHYAMYVYNLTSDFGNPSTLTSTG